MSDITISRSGTAWLQDMAAQGKVAQGGWANSPKAAYYASLDQDTSAPIPPPAAPKLPTTLEDLVKLRIQAEKEKTDDVADELQQQIRFAAAQNGVPPTGISLNETA